MQIMKAKFFLPVIKIVNCAIGSEYIHISDNTYDNYEEALVGMDNLVHSWSLHPHYKVIASEVQTKYVEL